MKIYLVRHGETEWNREEIFRGRKDISLNENGKKQAEETGNYLKRKKIKTIFTSPLVRSKQTAEIIGERIGAPIITIQELIDMDFGIWEGLSLTEVMERFPQEFEIWKSAPMRWKIEGAETLMDIRKRVSRGLRRLPSETNMVIVTHRVVCKIIALFFLKISNACFWNIKFDPASVSIFEFDGDRYVAHCINDTCHLRNVEAFYKDF